MCRLCRTYPETVQHVISGCQCLASTKYTNRHNKVGTYVHWVILKKLGIKVCKDWFKHEPKKIEEACNVVVMWDYTIPTEKKIGANRPDIVLHNKTSNSALIVDFLVPHNTNIINKTAEKLTKYRDLEIEIKNRDAAVSLQQLPQIYGNSISLLINATSFPSNSNSIFIF